MCRLSRHNLLSWFWNRARHEEIEAYLAKSLEVCLGSSSSGGIWRVCRTGIRTEGIGKKNLVRKSNGIYLPLRHTVDLPERPHDERHHESFHAALDGHLTFILGRLTTGKANRVTR